MSSEHIVSSLWGDNRGTQIAAYVDPPEDSPADVFSPVSLMMKMMMLPLQGFAHSPERAMLEVVDDTRVAHRLFEFECGIKEIKLVLHKDKSMSFWVMFDGHTPSHVEPEHITLRIARDGELKNGKIKQCGHVEFEGVGTRFGTLEEYMVTKLICVFSDETHLKNCVNIPPAIIRTYTDHVPGSEFPVIYLLYKVLPENVKDDFLRNNVP